MASLALYREARKVEDSMTLENGLLVLVKRQSRTLSPYGLTCRMNDRPMFLTFAGQEGNLGALLTERSGRCLSFGPKFDIGFDPDTVDLVADPKRGDLVVLGGALYVTAHLGGCSSIGSISRRFEARHHSGSSRTSRRRHSAMVDLHRVSRPSRALSGLCERAWRNGRWPPLNIWRSAGVLPGLTRTRFAP